MDTTTVISLLTAAWATVSSVIAYLYKRNQTLSDEAVKRIETECDKRITLLTEDRNFWRQIATTQRAALTDRDRLIQNTVAQLSSQSQPPPQSGA